MASMTYHESYGELTVAQLRAYKKHNVSPSDHDDLVETFGEDAHAAITAAVKKYSPRGSFSAWDMRNGEHGSYFYN